MVCETFERDSVKMSMTSPKDSFLVKQAVDGYPTFHADIVWKNVFAYFVLNVLAFLSSFHFFFSIKWVTFVYAIVVSFVAQHGVTCGAHRLYTHRSYKASYGLQVILLTLFTMCGQNCAYVWVRDHRQHHTHSDTVRDPHDSSRGFFFSHMGWLMVRKHPAVIAAGKTVDMTDIENNPLVMFHTKYYKSLYTIFAIIIPVAIPVLLWNENLWYSFLTLYIGRYFVLLHLTWLINSSAHMYGTRPYDNKQQATNHPLVALVSFGEGYHNYHHTFPWDFRASEKGVKFNSNAAFIELCARLGWATNLREASPQVVKAKAIRHGDQSHQLWGNNNVEVHEDLRSGDVHKIKKAIQHGDQTHKVRGKINGEVQEDMRSGDVHEIKTLVQGSNSRSTMSSG